MIAILNDVECELDAADLVVGSIDDQPTPAGLEQSLTVARRLGDHLDRIDVIAASKAVRLSRLLHNIRTKSKDAYLTKLKVKYLDSLSERSFGVLNGSHINIDSDLFKHSRIMAEDGESISQVRKRMLTSITALAEKDKHVLAVSHPFACQIAFNALLGRSHITLTEFWFRKGAMAILTKGAGWELNKAVNLIEDREYSLDDIYSNSIVG